jgi:hypothetical protein
VNSTAIYCKNFCKWYTPSTTIIKKDCHVLELNPEFKSLPCVFIYKVEISIKDAANNNKTQGVECRV